MARNRSSQWLALLLLFWVSASAGEAEGLTEVHPYDMEEVLIESDGATLSGTLYLPNRAGRHPALILTHGSGEGGRQGQYRSLANYFVGNGVAVLVYDKRGTGRSSGQYEETPDDVEYYGRDVLAGVELLRKRKEINASQVGVWGHSQGGWIGPWAATQSSEIAFVINVSGPGVSPFEQIAYQRMRQRMQEGFSAADADEYYKVYKAQRRYWRSGQNYEEAAAIVAAASDSEWFVEREWSATLERVEDFQEGEVDWLRKPFLDFDPSSVYETLAVPTLIVYGNLDWQIPVEASVLAIEAALARNPNQDVTIRRFDDTGHGIMVRGENNRSFFAPGYLELMLDWLRARVTVNPDEYP